jgi:NAD(P)-dependent dehydrogenase (short-subunit alcohol dehydrogenase family)
MKNWTTANIPNDLSDKVYVITGTSSGIGTVLTYELLKRGATVVAGNRNIEKAEKALQTINATNAALGAFLNWELDISSLKSVRKFSENLNNITTISQIDGLLLNAGIMALPERKLSVDGFEMQMATNVLGHHLLTSLLIHKIILAPQSVIVSTSSSASGVPKDPKVWDDLNAEQKYDPWEVYGVSKMAAYHFRDGLREILKKEGLSNKIKIVSTHPGLTSTPLFDDSAGVFGKVFRSVKSLFMMKPEQGALNSLRAALDPTIVDGSFIGPDGFTGFNGFPKPRKEYNPKMSLDPKLREKMWDYCNETTGAIWNL